uniref:NADH-ubiquinone oxidoreductase chain 6 n=2 Tax=Neoneuromus TaxID=1569766 RepID=A0A8K1WAZ8_9NEOP|nr:NADH dehydrogenase subunit 6 [Neoneuromus maclachlani]UFZ12901.1 NADH dehydrogenase subunit 6 [Neoneuromus ignobilis]
MIYLILSINLLITWNFIQMKHPLAMGLMLLLQTVMICLLSGLMLKTFWFSYILFLIMLGGMLVLFIYMTSLASNELFSISMKNLLFNMMMIFIMFIFILMEIYPSFNFMFNSDMNYTNNLMLINENSLDLIKLYNFPTMNLTLLLINYLFLTLIIIVKITSIFYGPLRQKN